MLSFHFEGSMKIFDYPKDSAAVKSLRTTNLIHSMIITTEI
jgi:hypothetical protein